MVTALAGLEEGAVTLEEEIDDLGDFTKYDQTAYAPGCWTRYPQNHQNQNVTLALTNSCNYYFYTVADRLGIDNLNKWASLPGPDVQDGHRACGGDHGRLSATRTCSTTRASASRSSGPQVQLRGAHDPEDPARYRRGPGPQL